MRRRKLMAAGVSGASLALPLVARAQQKVHTVLWVSTETQPDPFIDGFREGMATLGYIEGRNLSFVLRYWPGDPTKVLAALPELLATPADVIVSSGFAMRGLRTATGRPVLFALSGDPVTLGLAESLGRPGRNFTGLTFMSLDLAQKRVQLLREMLPSLRTFAILSDRLHPGEPAEHQATLKAAAALSIETTYCPFSTGPELDDALLRVKAANADAMLTYPDGVTLIHKNKVTAFAKANRLPSMWGWREFADAGGLASYGANQRATYARLASYADRILRGAKPADLPIEQPTKFELVVNAATARALNLAIAPTFLARADHVIE
jgi:putative ABC transport system substrate-binding protein